MKKRQYLLALSIAFLISGCDGKEEQTISETDSYVETYQEDTITETEPAITSATNGKAVEANEAAIKVFDKYIGIEHGAYDLIEKEEEEILLNGVIEVADSKIIGYYERTKCSRGIGGEITISKQDDDSLILDGEVNCYAGCGGFEEDIVYSLSDTKAFVIADFDYEDDSAHSVFLMERSGDELICTQMGVFPLMGVGVDAEGIYTQGEPEYTNDNIVEETFSSDTIEIIKQLFEENQLDYEQYIEEQMLYGAVDSSEVTITFADGTKKQGIKHYIWIPHAAFETVDMYVTEDGHVYMTAFTGTEDAFMTDDKAVTEMPTDK